MVGVVMITITIMIMMTITLMAIMKMTIVSDNDDNNSIMMIIMTTLLTGSVNIFREFSFAGWLFSFRPRRHLSRSTYLKFRWI